MNDLLAILIVFSFVFFGSAVLAGSLWFLALRLLVRPWRWLFRAFANPRGAP